MKFDVLSSFISTVYRYSNFEFSFDITDAQREDVYDDNGNLVKPKVDKDAWIGVSFGCEENKGVFDNHARGSTLLTLNPTSGEISLYEQLSRKKLIASPEVYRTDDMKILLPGNQGKIYNFKVSLINGRLTVKYKLSTDENYPETYLADMDLGYTPYGSVALMAYSFAGYTIDNVKIVNKDFAPVNVEIKYEENGMASMEDFKYTDNWKDEDLIANKIGTKSAGKGSGCSSALGGLSVLPLALGVLFTVRKRGKSDE